MKITLEQFGKLPVRWHFDTFKREVHEDRIFNLGCNPAVVRIVEGEPKLRGMVYSGCGPFDNRPQALQAMLEQIDEQRSTVGQMLCSLENAAVRTRLELEALRSAHSAPDEQQGDAQ